MSKKSDVKIEVYSALGQLVKVIIEENQAAGSYKYLFRAQDYGFSAGVYFLRMKVDGEVITRKLVEVK